MKQARVSIWILGGVIVFSLADVRAGFAAPAAAVPGTGQAVYQQHCAACHGEEGDGNGPAAVWLFPKPRDFSAGSFKIQSTPAGSLPSDEDLYQTITRGMPGSSMPSFTYLSEAERRDVVAYVKELTAYIDDTGKPVNRFAEAQARNEIKAPLEVPPEPAVSIDSFTRGKELFVSLQCVTCHGETGAADGPAAATLKDNWGLPLPPRDFNTGAFRGGHTGKDLYLRIAAGMAGTPMPPFGDDVMSPPDRWAVVHYIQSLRRKDIEVNDMLTPTDGRIFVSKAGKEFSTDPADRFWDRLEPTRVPVNPLWPTPNGALAVAVKAVHNGKQMAILLQWRDPSYNGGPVRVQDFQDAAALQFSLNGTAPFLGMGDARNPVNIWLWKAGWQESSEGRRADVQTVYESMHVDLYPETRPLFRTAEAAGNLNAYPVSPSAVEDANARGFGTFESQSAKEQNVRGKGIWRDGFWSVVFVRDLKSRDANDVKFANGKPVPVAFALWDGEQRDRNGRKEISNWFQLVLE